MLSKYLSDEVLVKTCSDEQWIRYMLRFEVALAKVQAAHGLIPVSAAKQIAAAFKQYQPTPGQLSEGTLENGVPIIPLLAFAKKRLPDTAKDFLHYGVTSQDVMDTAQVLIIKDVINVIENRILKLLKKLGKIMESNGTTPCMAHTRGQQAVPILFGIKIAAWANPLIRHMERLQQMKLRLLVIQLGGAAGSLNGMGKKGNKVAKALAKELGLQTALPWHSQRDIIVEFTNWLALVSGSLGKMAADILILSQTEIAEITTQTPTGGKSSSMPHKQNNVLAEGMVALANMNAALVSTQCKSMIHAGERDATTWAMEWITIPQMIANTGTTLQHALTISNGMRIHTKRMQENIALSHGMVYAAVAVNTLSKKMSKHMASGLVEKACLLVNANMHFSEALQQVKAGKKNYWDTLFRSSVHDGIALSVIEDCLLGIQRVTK